MWYSMTTMNYRDKEKRRILSLLGDGKLIADSGNGKMGDHNYQFALCNPQLNLWDDIRDEAINYFHQNRIKWWKWREPHDDTPTRHLLSSQVACVNHLFPIRQNKYLATAILKGLDSEVECAVELDGGYVAFEFIGSDIPSLLHEGSKGAFTRGAQCTSVDAAMIASLKSGGKRLFLIEWKYTEKYPCGHNLLTKKPERGKRYNQLIESDDSPFVQDIPSEAYYFEPFYQMMRQTLFGWQSMKLGDKGISSYKNVHVIPEQNTDLRQKITSTHLRDKFHNQSLHDVWLRCLKNKTLFIGTTPEALLSPVRGMNASQTFWSYLEERYWKSKW